MRSSGQRCNLGDKGNRESIEAIRERYLTSPKQELAQGAQGIVNSCLSPCRVTDLVESGPFPAQIGGSPPKELGQWRSVLDPGSGLRGVVGDSAELCRCRRMAEASQTDPGGFGARFGIDGPVVSQNGKRFAGVLAKERKLRRMTEQVKTGLNPSSVA